MDIKVEILKEYIAEYINNRIQDFKIDANDIADTAALHIISLIKDVITNDEYSDFDVVEEIVCIFESYGIDCGGRHDFG